MSVLDPASLLLIRLLVAKLFLLDATAQTRSSNGHTHLKAVLLYVFCSNIHLGKNGSNVSLEGALNTFPLLPKDFVCASIHLMWSFSSQSSSFVFLVIGTLSPTST